jgi:hypothetical protein
MPSFMVLEQYLLTMTGPKRVAQLLHAGGDLCVSKNDRLLVV